MTINNDFQRMSNISRILEIIWRNKKISRSDISQQLGLYRSTVSNIITYLLEEKLIEEGTLGKATEKGGRKPVYLSMNPNRGCIIGIELQYDSYKVHAINLVKEPIYSKCYKTNPDYVRGLYPELPLRELSPIQNIKMEQKARGHSSLWGQTPPTPEQLFESIIDNILTDIIPKVKIHNIPILGICIGLPGIIDIDKGIILQSDPFNLKNYDYGKKLGNKYNIPLLMENDAKCLSWLQLANNSHISQKDFLCVLARNQQMNGNNQENGIGIGISILMNGRIINGHNFGAGEYVSTSWRENKKGQTGLPQAVISTINTVEDSYKEWVKDLFQTLTPIVPLLEPNYIFLHGQNSSRKDIILDTIHSEVSQFESICSRTSTQLIIMNEDKFEIAEGAACMFIQKLFEPPVLEKKRPYSNLRIEEVLNHN